VLAYLVAVAYALALGVGRRLAEAAPVRITLLFIGIMLLFAGTAGNLFDAGENYRTRFTVEPLVLAAVALAVRDAWRWIGATATGSALRDLTRRRPVRS
jgi:hypothetical protein